VARNSQWRSASDEDWELALARESVIRSLADQTGFIAGPVATASEELGISRSLVYRLVAKFRERPQVSSLLPSKRGRRSTSRALPIAAEVVLQEAIDRVYLQREKPRLSDLLKEVERECRRKGLRVPNYRTIKRRVDAIDARESVRKRSGLKAANDRFRPTSVLSTADLLPLERVQIDHTLVDVVIVDEGDRLPIGRPWLTLVIDVASRAVLGFSVSLDEPSTASVALALVQAVLPKDLWLADRELEVPWPMWGLPELLQLDNAPEFHSRALVRGAQEYGVRIDYRPPASPHFGGHIERLIGTTMGAVHVLPGTTFSNIAEKGDYPSEKTAALTLVELERWLALQIAGVYHQSVHSTISKPPASAWFDGLARRRQAPRKPEDAQTFFLDFLPEEWRLIRRDGIRMFNIHYWDNVLSPLAGRSSKRVLIKYDPRNLSRVFYQDDSGHYWPIPYRNLGAPPISLWEQREAMKRLHAEGHHLVDERLIFETALAQRNLVDSARKTTRKRRNKERRQHLQRTTIATQAVSDSAQTTEDPNLPPFGVEEWS
jgi:putative transposase